jgi:hypothetical protein
MKLFHCCCEGSPKLFFESTSCTVCGRPVGFCPDSLRLRTFQPEADADGCWTLADEPSARYRPCANRVEHDVCNWMVPTEDEGQTFCAACRLNEIIPDLTVPQNLVYWAKLETAKRRTLYTILSLGLPLSRADADPPLTLRFRFLADKAPDSEFTQPLPDQEPVFTGHASGEITINVAEADDIARTRARVRLGERYRTLLGHFRHEIGHYYWDVLVAPDEQRLSAFRELFGDERQDYEAAKEAHYGASGGADEGLDAVVSEYAAMHPWEDWAETWAHYLHLIDTLQTAGSLEIGVGERAFKAIGLPQQTERPDPAPTLIEAWMALSIALNSLNRSMGLLDPYPFVLTDPVQQKLTFVHDIVCQSRETPVAPDA